MAPTGARPDTYLPRPPNTACRQVLVLVSPYSWLPAWTAKDKWLGGYVGQDGKPVWSADTLQQTLGGELC